MPAQDLAAALTAHLADSASVGALVGSRIWPDVLPKDAAQPALVYTVVSSVSHESLEGGVGTATSRVQIDSYAATRIGANQLSTAVRQALQGLVGDLDELPVSSIMCVGARRYQVDLAADGSRVHRYLTLQDYSIVHDED